MKTKHYNAFFVLAMSSASMLGGQGIACCVRSLPSPLLCLDQAVPGTSLNDERVGKAGAHDRGKTVAQSLV